MRSKVTLKELLISQIICAILIAADYWMLARNDWQDYYTYIQTILFASTFAFFFIQAMRIRKYKKESFDELAITNLKRCDSICLKIAVVSIIIVAFLGAVEVITGTIIGYLLVVLLIVLAIVRSIIFSVMDSKGV